MYRSHPLRQVAGAVALLCTAASCDDDSTTGPDPAPVALVLDRPAAAVAAADVAAADSLAILAIATRLDAAWLAGNASAWTSEYTADAKAVNILGGTLDGAQAILDRHATLFAGPFRGSRLVSTPTRMRFLGPLAAVLDMDQQQTGYVALPPGVQATTPGVLRTRVIHVVSKVGAQWKIVFTQNTALLPAP